MHSAPYTSSGLQNEVTISSSLLFCDSLLPSPSLGVRLSRCVCICRIRLDGEGNVLYPVFSSFVLFLLTNVNVNNY